MGRLRTSEPRTGAIGSMPLLRRCVPLLCGALALTSRAAELHAADGVSDLTQQERRRAPSLVNSVGLSFAYQAPLTLNKSVPLGAGLTYTRDYFVSSRTALGIHGALRFFPDSPWHIALGYGLNFKHYAGDFGESPRDGFYLLYGLLLQMNWLQGAQGSSTGHDTRLALGFDWRSDSLLSLIELGYHLTQVRAFDRDTLWWPYTELVVGSRF